MESRRREPFRYSMEQPLLCQVEITGIDQLTVDGKLAAVELLDVSKNGCKVRTLLDFHAGDHFIQCTVHFTLGDEQFAFPGQIRWQRQLQAPYHYYGIQLSLTYEEKEKIYAELRTLAADRKIIVN